MDVVNNAASVLTGGVIVTLFFVFVALLGSVLYQNHFGRNL